MDYNVVYDPSWDYVRLLTAVDAVYTVGSIIRGRICKTRSDCSLVVDRSVHDDLPYISLYERSADVYANKVWERLHPLEILAVVADE